MQFPGRVLRMFTDVSEVVARQDMSLQGANGGCLPAESAIQLKRFLIEQERHFSRVWAEFVTHEGGGICSLSSRVRNWRWRRCLFENRPQRAKSHPHACSK